MYMGDGENPSSAYDAANGNILSMSKNGLQQNASPLIEKLNLKASPILNHLYLDIIF